jgi:hypothetical protein
LVNGDVIGYMRGNPYDGTSYTEGAAAVVFVADADQSVSNHAAATEIYATGVLSTNLVARFNGDRTTVTYGQDNYFNTAAYGTPTSLTKIPKAYADATYATIASLGGYVPTTRTISTTSPLTGGGDLSANRTLGLAGLTGFGTAGQAIRVNSGANAFEYYTPTTGTVTSVSVITANGFSGTVANATTTPAITLTADTATVFETKTYGSRYTARNQSAQFTNLVLTTNNGFRVGNSNGAPGKYVPLFRGGNGTMVTTTTLRVDSATNIPEVTDLKIVNTPATSTGSYDILTRNATGAVEKINLSTILPSARYAASGNGSSTSITIPHGLTGITSNSLIWVTAKNATSSGFTFVTTDATNITINYSVAPASGTNNLSYDIMIKP